MSSVTQPSSTGAPLPPERLKHMYRQMRRIRCFEEAVDRLFQQGLIWGTFHLYIGQEASAVGAIEALRSDDYITSTHRGHGHCIAKGASIPLMMAELRGKETGYCRGRGGSMHIAESGYGKSGRQRNRGRRRSHCGRRRAGHQEAGMGSGRHVLFRRRRHAAGRVPRGGQFRLGVPAARGVFVRKQPVRHVDARGERAGQHGRRPRGRPLTVCPGVSVDGNDVLAVYEAAREAVARARAGRGPTLLETRTYRLRGHSKSDANRYRTREEIERWRRRCPIMRFERWLAERGVMTPDDFEAVKAEVLEEVQAAIAFAESEPDPDVGQLAEGVYA